MFQTFISEPLYNALVFITGMLPGNNIGLSIIILTILIKVLLIPLQNRALTTQREIKKIEPELKRIKKECAGNKELEARKVMGLYREHNVNPFAGFAVILIQIPIFIGLFLVFREGLESVRFTLYPFVQVPSHVNPIFFGVDLGMRSIVFAVGIAITQFIQTYISIPPPSPRENNSSFADDFSRSLSFQMKYIMPIVLGVVSAGLPAAVSVYWLTSTVFSIIYELWYRRLHPPGGLQVSQAK